MVGALPLLTDNQADLIWCWHSRPSSLHLFPLAIFPPTWCLLKTREAYPAFQGHDSYILPGTLALCYRILSTVESHGSLCNSHWRGTSITRHQAAGLEVKLMNWYWLEIIFTTRLSTNLDPKPKPKPPPSLPSSNRHPHQPQPRS